MGPLMLDLSACELTPEEIDMLDHPLVGGIILFTRNYHDQKQLSDLVQQTRRHARNDILIAVDHEGGRVQRFREGFSLIPAMGKLYKKAAGDSRKARHYACQFGWLMASEVLAFDIDISFAPVLDIWGVSDVIGDRSFHANPEIIVDIASEFIKGMHLAGMKSTGKHFPGHGNVKEDSHIAIPIDARPEQEILDTDMAIFTQIHQRGLLDAIMPAHVIYPSVDDLPAGFSDVWINTHLRSTLGFDGVVFSDDLSMQGAAQIGSFPERATRALNAGCDMVLVCNDPEGAGQVIDGLPSDFKASHRSQSMRKNSVPIFPALINTQQYKDAKKTLDLFHAE